MKPRESIAAKVRTARPKAEPVDLTPDEAVDVAAMVDDLGRLESKAKRYSADNERKTAEIAGLKLERDEALHLAQRNARNVRDTFIASALAAGWDPDQAIGVADRAMDLRDKRK